MCFLIGLFLTLPTALFLWGHAGSNALYLGCEHVSNPVQGALQEQGPDQEADEHDVREQGAEVHHLQANRRDVQLLIVRPHAFLENSEKEWMCQANLIARVSFMQWWTGGQEEWHLSKTHHLDTAELNLFNEKMPLIDCGTIPLCAELYHSSVWVQTCPICKYRVRRLVFWEEFSVTSLTSFLFYCVFFFIRSVFKWVSVTVSSQESCSRHTLGYVLVTMYNYGKVYGPRSELVAAGSVRGSLSHYSANQRVGLLFHPQASLTRGPLCTDIKRLRATEGLSQPLLCSTWIYGTGCRVWEQTLGDGLGLSHENA